MAAGRDAGILCICLSLAAGSKLCELQAQAVWPVQSQTGSLQWQHECVGAADMQQCTAAV